MYDMILLVEIQIYKTQLAELNFWKVKSHWLSNSSQ